jgi:5-methylphenazine-1-carboxylate 1-monooxygenase
MSVLIIGGGIGGLTLALTLHDAGIESRVFEATPEIRPLGVGINVLPHASAELCRLGLDAELTRVSVEPAEAAFFNRFGQHILSEPLGRAAGYGFPQFSIHRGELQMMLLDAVRHRLGDGAVSTGCRCTSVDQDDTGATARFVDSTAGRELPSQRGDVVIACDGLHSVIRKQLHRSEGAPVYSGINMWRGVTVWDPILTGKTMIRAGWFTHGKLVIYPIRESVDSRGRQLVNWLVELETPADILRDWNRRGRLEDFIGWFADWRFEWLDVPAFLRAAEVVFEFPMVDQDPLPRWTDGRVTLLGDAAHPMYARGSNGAAQAILDARVLADCIVEHGLAPAALHAYEAQRRPATAAIVEMNRSNPPDAILREVFERTGDARFSRIEDVVSPDELIALLDRYKQVTGNVPPRSSLG